MITQIQDKERDIFLALIIKREVKGQGVSYQLAQIIIKALSLNKSYEGFSFKVKELYNINNTGHINKYKVIYSRVSEGN